MSPSAPLSFLNQKRCVTFPAAMEMEPKSKAVSRACSPPVAGAAATGLATAAIAAAGSVTAGAGFAGVTGRLPGFATKTAIARPTAITAAPRARFLFMEPFGAMLALRAMELSFQCHSRKFACPVAATMRGDPSSDAAERRKGVKQPLRKHRELPGHHRDTQCDQYQPAADLQRRADPAQPAQQPRDAVREERSEQERHAKPERVGREQIHPARARGAHRENCAEHRRSEE